MFSKVPIQEAAHMEVAQKPPQRAAYLVDRGAGEVTSFLDLKMIHLLYRDAWHRTV